MRRTIYPTLVLILGILVVALVLGQAGPAPSPTSAPSLSPVAVGGNVPSAPVLTAPPPTPSPSVASSKPLLSPSPTATPAPPWKAVHCKGTEPDDHASARAPDYTSTTWAGYINTKSNGKLVTCIEGAWVVPNAKCAAKGPSQDVFIWVGTGGWSSSFTGVNHRLEQVGVEIFCPPGGGPAGTSRGTRRPPSIRWRSGSTAWSPSSTRGHTSGRRSATRKVRSR